MVRYQIRAALPDDVAELLELARFLDSLNLPHEESALREQVELSCRSFAGDVADARDREFMFVLRDQQSGRLLGTSAVFAQLGRPKMPYVYFEVGEEERRSVALNRRFRHRLLRMRYVEDGPSAIGGLVVHQEARRSPDRLGELISYVRFLWIAMRRADFRDEVVAELLPPQESDGSNAFWDALGSRYTGLSYRDADRLSKRDKSFIAELFPERELDVTLMPHAAQAILGTVGAPTRGAEALLKRIGFLATNRVDPFDGGPHLLGLTDKIDLVRRARKIVSGTRAIALPLRRSLVGVESPESPWFQAALVMPGQKTDETVQRLGILPGEPFWALGLPKSP